MKIAAIETLPVSVGPGYDYAVIIVLVRTDLLRPVADVNFPSGRASQHV
jgi:hypothetical protein